MQLNHSDEHYHMHSKDPSKSFFHYITHAGAKKELEQVAPGSILTRIGVGKTIKEQLNTETTLKINSMGNWNLIHPGTTYEYSKSRNLKDGST